MLAVHAELQCGLIVANINDGLAAARPQPGWRPSPPPDSRSGGPPSSSTTHETCRTSSAPYAVQQPVSVRTGTVVNESPYIEGDADERG
jgi:hypothetical protein